MLSFSLYLNQYLGPLNMGINGDPEDNGYSTLGTFLFGCTACGGGVCLVKTHAASSALAGPWYVPVTTSQGGQLWYIWTTIKVTNNTSLLPRGNSRLWECRKKLHRDGPPDFTINEKLRNNCGVQTDVTIWRRLLLTANDDEHGFWLSSYLLCHQHNSSLTFVHIPLVSLVR